MTNGPSHNYIRAPEKAYVLAYVYMGVQKLTRLHEDTDRPIKKDLSIMSVLRDRAESSG